MSDYLPVTPGVGVNVAGDTVAGVFHQAVKIEVGADGAAEYVSDANPLPVSDGGGVLTVDGSVSLAAAIPAGTNNIGNMDVATLPGIAYMGEETITQDGSSKACTLPANTNMVEISAEGGAVRYSINGAASANSGGFVPENQSRMVMHTSNLTSLAVFGASAAVKAHLLYWQEP